MLSCQDQFELFKKIASLKIIYEVTSGLLLALVIIQARMDLSYVIVLLKYFLQNNISISTKFCFLLVI